MHKIVSAIERRNPIRWRQPNGFIERQCHRRAVVLGHLSSALNSATSHLLHMFFLMSTILLPLDYRSIALMVSPINGRSAHETPRRIEEPTKRQQEQVFRNNNEAEGILRRWRLSATPRQRTVSSDWFRRLSSFLRSCFFLVVVVTFSFLFCAPSLSTPFTNGPLL